MQTNAKALLQELAQITDSCTGIVKTFKTLSPEQLNYRQHAGSWSILECIEHLNLYGDFYLPEIEKSILAQKEASSATVFKSGLLGNYFAGLMKGVNGKIKKIPTPKDKNPIHSKLSITTIDRFLKQQERLQSLLRLASTADLTRTKTPISLTKLIRLRLGDTFRFFTYHIERHIAQAQKVLQHVPEMK